jgi:hypothetical protein
LTSVKNKKAKRWLIPAMVVLVLLISTLALWQQIQRGIAAYVIYRKHVFFAPAKNNELPAIQQCSENIVFYWDIAKFRLDQKKRVKMFNPILKPLIKEINRHQKAGESMTYSMNIYREIRWRMNFTSDTAATRLRIIDLKNSLSDSAVQRSARIQQPSDGSWGAGINVWYLRMYYSIENHFLDSCLQPQYPLSFLDPINSPDQLKKHLTDLLNNDFTKTGIFNREELDETFSGIARLLKNKKNLAFAFHPELDSALIDFVKQWQNPKTGCWGQWVTDRYGRTWKMDDMGMTFHVISDLHGQVAHKDLIAKRLLEVDNLDFPTGIKFDGNFSNHLNWDAVKIFRYAWPSLDSMTRESVRKEINKMLNWCLTESYQSDGSFKTDDLDDTTPDAFFYSVSFLKETGYFKKKKRFWTNQEFPKAAAIKDHIKTKLLSIGLSDPTLKETFEDLND